MMEEVKDSERLCRICLKKEEDLKCIYDLVIYHNSETPLVDFLMKITNIQFEKSDGFPSEICTRCIESLTAFYILIETCIKSQEVLRQKHLGQEEKNVENDVKENIELDFNESSLEGNDFDDGQMQSNHIEYSNKNEKISEREFIEKKEGDCYKCETCLKEFANKRRLNSHLRIHKDSRCEKVKNFQCDVCGMEFVYEYLLKQHSYKHMEKKPFPCPKCNKGCTTKETLRRHMIVHDVNYTKKKHVCKVCGREFLYPSFLAEHMKNHTGERPFLCNLCGKGFRQSGSLAYHMKSHTGEKSYKCEECKNYFSTPGTLRVHMRIHTNERPYVCDICGMAFKQSTDMKNHRENHIRKKKVLCFVCGKTVGSTGQLTVHMRSHTGEKPHKCPTCPKAFSTRTTLVKHTRIHTGERPYSCEVCNKAFNQRSTLKTHLNTHKRQEAMEKGETVEEIVDGNCIVIDENIGAQYSIETVGNLSLSNTEVNVVVLPTTVSNM